MQECLSELQEKYGQIARFSIFQEQIKKFSNAK
jgi:hypothetical protein